MCFFVLFFFFFFVQHGSDHRRHFSERRNLFLPLFSSIEQTKSPRVSDLQQRTAEATAALETTGYI